MDCYYAAIEMRDNPALQTVPLAVAHPDVKRGVVTTANYIARKFGVRSAMPTVTALRLCPELVLVAPRFELYQKESKRIRRVFEKYTALVEPLSLDEAYLDVSNSTHFRGSASLLAKQIIEEIKDETGLPASAGVAPNKFLAKVASAWKKPNGLTIITEKDIERFMHTLPVKKIPGVGPKTYEKLKALGYEACGDLQKVSAIEMFRIFGEWGGALHQFAFGKDSREVEPERESKSLSVENTFEEDISSIGLIRTELFRLLKDLNERLNSHLKGHADQKIAGCFIKVKTFNFKTFTRERAARQVYTLEEYVNLLHLWQHPVTTPIRLLGIGVRFAGEQNESTQLDLFDL